MDELSQIVQKYINDEKKILIQRICNEEISLLNKSEELINKYVINDENCCNTHINKKLKVNEGFENMDFLSNDVNMSSDNSSDNIEMEHESPATELNINQSEIDIDSLNHKLKNMSLKEIQTLCEKKSIGITKVSLKSGKTIKKSKNELMKLIISNS